MAVDKARYQGEPVAAVVAESPSLADDAAELVQSNTNRSILWSMPSKRSPDKSILHEEAGTNRVWNGVWESRRRRESASRKPHMWSTSTACTSIASPPRRLKTTSSSANGIPKKIASITGAIIPSPRLLSSFWPPHLNIHIDQDPGADFRYRRQLRHQDHQLSADGGVRAGFEESRRPSGEMGRNPLRAHGFERAWKRAHLPRHACRSRQKWRDHRHRLAAY